MRPSALQLSSRTIYIYVKVLLWLHPSLYRAVKLTFQQDIGGLAHDGAITNEMATGSMSQTVGVLTSAMFSLGTQPL